MTAKGSVETAINAITKGASDYIAKPFEIAAVAQLLRRYLQARQEKSDESGDRRPVASDIQRYAMGHADLCLP